MLKTPLVLFQLNQQPTSTEELNGFINSPIYVTSLTATENSNNNPTASKPGGVCATSVAPVAREPAQKQLPNGHEPADILLTQQFADRTKEHNRVPPGGDAQKAKAGVATEAPQALDVRKLTDRRASSPFQNGRTELLIGTEDNKLKTTAIVESNNNKLGVDPENRLVDLYCRGFLV